MAASATGRSTGALDSASENLIRWVVFGLAFNKVLVNQIRWFVGEQIKKEYENVKMQKGIDSQSKSGGLRERSFDLKYENINGNGELPKGQDFDYRVTSHVDFAKLYLQSYLAKFNAFDEECDSSTILQLLIRVPVFSDSVKQAANNVRQARNFWAHHSSDWDSAKSNKCFDDMEQLVKVLGLPRGDEEHLVNELNYWKKKGVGESVLFKPGSLSQDDVLCIAHELGSSWKMVGRVLMVPEDVLDLIQEDETKVSEQCYRVLRYWKETYPSDATYHRLALALQHPAVDRVDLAAKYCGLQLDKDVQAGAATNAPSSVPAEIRGRGYEAERDFQKAMQTGKVKVYRGRIMLLGQDRAGKTSLRKSLLGLPFDPEEESTVGVEVDEVENWMPSKRKKREVSEFEDQMARFIARDLTKSEPDDNDSTVSYLNVEETSDQLEEKKHHEVPKLLPDGDEPGTDTEEDGYQALLEETPVDKSEESDEQFKINLNDVTYLVVRYLQSLRLEDDIKSEEVILTLWDFAGQHLYYASHSVFLSGRAVYILVYNLNKDLLATAEPCVKQGVHDIRLDNANNETNLDNLLSWLVSVHSIRSDTNKNVAHKGTKLSYLRPPVIIVGTNLDQPFGDVETTEKHIKKSILGKEYAKHVRAPYFRVDNTTENNEGVQKLRHKIMEVLKDEPYMPDEVPLRWFNFERVVDALVAKQTYFMDLDQLLSVIRQVCQIEDEEEVTAMLNFYHDLGEIIKHGRTVVLRAQWLFELFKQLITVRPFDEADPLYVNCWNDLEVNGILRMSLLDHVFSKFIKKGLRKQDILDMMELHGLIAKLSMATDENQDEQRYFVPTQLRSSPSALCEIKPSKCDPCPLILHFLDGFVPHFPQLVSKFIHWCSENGLKETPQLFNNGARLFIGKQITFALILICRKRFIKIVLKTRNPSSCKSQSINASNKMAIEVRNFIERTLDGFSRDLSWLSNLRYELSVVCTHCQQRECDLDGLMSCCHDDRLHLLRVRPGEELICMENFSDETVKVPGWEMWFEVSHSQTKEPKEDILEAVGASSELKTTGQRVETKKRKQKKNFTGHSSRVPPKRKKGIEGKETAQPSGTVHEMQQEISDLDESASFKPGTISQDDVLLIAHELGSSWEMVGRVLKVPDAVIDEIEAGTDKVSKKCYRVLRGWQEMYPSNATYHRLARALMHPAVGRVDLVDKYCSLQLGKDVAVGTSSEPETITQRVKGTKRRRNKNFTASDEEEYDVDEGEESIEEEKEEEDQPHEPTKKKEKKTGKVSKPLVDLVNDASDSLKKICNRFDTPLSGLGNYEDVAKYYHYDIFTIQARFKTSPDGQSKALILAMIGEHPRVTVENFARVVEKQAKRKDVAILLSEFDCK